MPSRAMVAMLLAICRIETLKGFSDAYKAQLIRVGGRSPSNAEDSRCFSECPVAAVPFFGPGHDLFSEPRVLKPVNGVLGAHGFRKHDEVEITAFADGFSSTGGTVVMDLVRFFGQPVGVGRPAIE